MATQRVPPVPASPKLALTHVASFPGLRALTWDGDMLYASRGYTLVRTRTGAAQISWEPVAQYRPPWWRNASSAWPLTSRLCRDGFHALSVLSSGAMVGAVPGAIVTRAPGDKEFHVSYSIQRGTRPLQISAAADGTIYWGEYFDNPRRDEVHIYASRDQGLTWQVAYTFPKGSIRHVHNVVYDRWDNCLWILTGDDGTECRILRATTDCRTIDVVLSGSQQARAAALIPMPDALYFPTDTPYEPNHVYRLDRRGGLTRVCGLPSSSIYGCAVGDAMFFSTMAEPSEVNSADAVGLFGTVDGASWERLLQWQKDGWPKALFQYGNAFLPSGENNSGLLALTTLGVEGAGSQTSLWRVTP